MHAHELTDGYRSIERAHATPQELFDLAHDLVNRVDGLEWAFACLVLITLQHMDVIGMPSDPQGYRDTLATLEHWLHEYRLGQEEIERDRKFMDAPE
jgi:hypothetical protein